MEPTGRMNMELCSRVPYSLVCPRDLSTEHCSRYDACAPSLPKKSIEDFLLEHPEIYAKLISPKQVEYLVNAYVGQSSTFMFGGEMKLSTRPGALITRDGTDTTILDAMTGWQGERPGSLRRGGESKFRKQLALVKHARLPYVDYDGKRRMTDVYVATEFGARVAECFVTRVQKARLAAEDDAA